MLKRNFVLVFVVLITFIGVVSAAAFPLSSQVVTKPSDLDDRSPSGDLDLDDKGLRRADNGDWFRPVGEDFRTNTEALTRLAAGGPDEYGYSWDSVPLNWIDASGGEDTGVSRDNPGSGPIPVGFPFKYYENTYSHLYVSLHGYISFNDEELYVSQSRLPTPPAPNDVIAPHWAPISDVNGYVRYLRGGSAPNRWIAVEWSRLDGDFNNEYTFEAIFKENGDILFQYGDMYHAGEKYWCQMSGIEDSRGVDGLSITEFCEFIEGYHAVISRRPPASARARIDQPYQGSFAGANQNLAYAFRLHNSGELGTDTYDLTANSAWLIVLVDRNGENLVDTDGDGIVDSGSVPQGGSVLIGARVQSPTVANIADDNVAEVFVRSSIDPAKSSSASLRAAVPTSFAQAFVDQADGGMSLDLIKPDEQIVQKITPDDYYGSNTAVSETPGFANVWAKYTYLGNGIGITDIEYALLDDMGGIDRGATKLTNHRAAMIDTNDYSPVVDVAPNGNIGVAWYRYLHDDNSGLHNYNVWFALLNRFGEKIYGPVNVTNNNAWGSWSDMNVPQYTQPRVAATDNNRWVLSFRRYVREDFDMSDIVYATRNADGTTSRLPTRFTNSAEDGHYYDPTLASLNNNRVLLAYSDSGDIVYSVLDSFGGVVKGATYFGGEGYDPAAAQIGAGRTLLAWSGRDGEIEFALISNAAYHKISGPTELSNPAAITGNRYVSVTNDSSGHGILTWMDSDSSMRRHIYYGLVGDNGRVITRPTIFLEAEQAPSGDRTIESSFEGYGNSSHTIDPTSSGVDNYISGPRAVSAQSGGGASIPIQFGNLGETQATSVKMTMTVPGGFTYRGDSSGVKPSLDDDTLTWTFGKSLNFLGHGRFTIYVGVPVGEIGKQSIVPFMVEADQNDANDGNNAMNVRIMISEQLYLPVIIR